MAARPSRWPTVLALLASAPIAVLGVGFLFHTDFEPDVFGKWSLGWALFLIAWWVLLLPGLFLLVRFVFRTQRLEMPSGRVLVLRPCPKLLAVLALGWLFVQGAEAQLARALGRGVTTPLASDTFHPYLQNVPKPGRRRFDTNRLGFRGSEIAFEKPPDTTRIFVLGGSTVFCAPIALEQTHAEVMRRRLEVAHPARHIEVQNAGAEWHSSQHSLIKYLTWIRELDPDVLVVWHAINDLYRSFSPPAFAVGPYRRDYGHFHGAVAAMARPEAAGWRIAGMRLDRWFSDFRCDRARVVGPEGEGVKGIRQMFFPRSAPVTIREWKSLPAFERNLRDLVRYARSHETRVLLASQPYLYREDLSPEDRELLWFPLAHQEHGTRPSLASMIDGMGRYNATARRVAEEEGALFLDLAARVPRDTLHLYDDVHYTAEGCRIIGEALAETLEDAGWVE